MDKLYDMSLLERARVFKKIVKQVVSALLSTGQVPAGERDAGDHDQSCCIP
jgi:hypothetical protein